MSISRILVPIDFSTHSDAAMELAREYAREFGAELHLLHVFPEAIALAPPYGPALPADFGMQIERSAERHFEEWRAERCPADARMTSHIRRGNASAQIIDLAKQCDADLIIMGTRGLTGLRHVMMGSVAERTVRGAPCPVMTTRDREKDDREG